MIATLKGTLLSKSKGRIVVDVGGVGFSVQVPASLLDRLAGIGHEVKVFTHLHVRENELTLYGFGREEELALFDLLLTVSGVGPKVALAALSALSPQSLREAIGRERAEVLAQVPGIGPKTARKIVFELKDKVEAGAEPAAVAYLTDADAEVIAALTSLGYSVVEAQSALRALPAEEMPVEERIRLALNYFAGQ